jgi:hypothetical protein
MTSVAEPRTLSRGRRVLLTVMLMAILAAVVEGFLRAVMAFVPNTPLTSVSQTVEHPVLGHTLNPDYPGHDANGFRNAKALAKADLVVLGDSMTYGDGVPVDRAWPQQLGRLAGIQAYNMGVSGYGPVQSLSDVERALDLGPRVVLEAFTSANDLFDAFAMVYYRDDQPDLKTTEPQQKAAIQDAESRQTLREQIDAVYSFRAPPVSSTADAVDDVKVWLSEHVMIYRLLRAMRDRLRASREVGDPRAEVDNYPQDLLASGPTVLPTIFTPRYRLAAAQLEDPRILEGLQISLRAMERMRQRVAERGGCFAVVMIPTKEYVYGSAAAEGAANTPARASFVALLQQEEAIWTRMRQHLDDKGIPFVEVAPGLSRQLRQGGAVFPASSDGHPTTLGHDAIAQAVAASGVCGLSAVR